VAEAEEKGQLSLFGWFYRFETGHVHQFDNELQQFVDVFEAADAHHVAV
jgi:carbonic anhydrase